MSECALESPYDVHIEYIRGDVKKLETSVQALSTELKEHMQEEAEKDAAIDKKLDRIYTIGYIIIGLLTLQSAGVDLRPIVQPLIAGFLGG